MRAINVSSEGSSVGLILLVSLDTGAAVSLPSTSRRGRAGKRAAGKELDTIRVALSPRDALDTSTNARWNLQSSAARKPIRVAPLQCCRASASRAPRTPLTRFAGLVGFEC